VLRNYHHELLHTSENWTAQYKNLIEHLFFSPSHYSIGLQFADLIAGAISRYFEHGDNRWFKLIENGFRKDPKRTTIEGFGLVRFPKGKWKEMTLSRAHATNLQ
jgi:hypothetical protein